jgi:PAS domain S-box-containing protein
MTLRLPQFRSIRARLAAAFIGVTLLSGAVGVPLTIMTARRTLGAAIEQALESQADAFIEDVEHHLDTHAATLKAWSRLAVMDNVLIGDPHLELENFLLERRERPDVEVLTATDRGGVVVASTDAGRVGQKSTVDVAALPLLDEDGLRRGPFPAFDAGEDAFLVLACPIRSRLVAGNLGYLILDLRWTPLQEIMRTFSIVGWERGPRAFAALRDPDGRLIVSGDPARLTDAERRPARYLSAVAVADGGRAPIVRGMSVVVRVDRAEAYSGGRQQVVGIVSAALAGLVIAAAASVLVAGGLSRRVRELADGTRQVAEGHLDHRVPEHGGDEIAALAGRFNVMTASLAGAHDALADSAARWRSLVEHAPDIIVTLLPDGTVGFMNRVLPGYQVDKVIGTPVYAWVEPEYHGMLREGIEKVMRTGEAVQFEARGSGPHGSTAWYSLRMGPISRGGVPLGVTLIATDITERRRLEEETIDLAETERRRIGRDLHDGLGQALTGTALLARGLSGRMAAKGIPEAAEVARIGGLLQDAVAQARGIARGLYPLGLDSRSLKEALEVLVAGVEGMPGVSCRVEGDVPEGCFTETEATHLFRIAQEAVINALRHSGARQIVITIGNGPAGRGIAIRDDGGGLPEGGREGLGFRLMRYRAAIIGGILHVRKGEPSGTIIECRL